MSGTATGFDDRAGRGRSAAGHLVTAAGAAANAAGSIAGLRSLEEVEREVIAATLEATRYQIARSAQILGISRKTLLEKRKKYGLK